MVLYEFNNSLRVKVVDEAEEVDLFMFIVGDKDDNILESFPLTNGCWYMYNTGEFMTYTEYVIKSYIIRNNRLIEHNVYKFDATDKNVFINLNPTSQEEYDIWIDYLIDIFIKNIKCKVYINNDSRYVLKKNSDNLIMMNDNITPFGFYASYTVDWNQPHGHPKNSYQLINNVLLRV